MLFRQRRPCSTRYKSRTGIRYPTLTNDPRRSLKCISPKTVPHTTRPLDSWAALPNSYPNALRAMQGGSLYHFYYGLWYDPAERRTHDLLCKRRTCYRLSQPNTVRATQVCHATDTGHDTPPVSGYKHRADLSLCFPLMWNITLEYTTTHFNVLGQTRSWNPSSTFHTHQRTLNFMMLIWWLSVRSSGESVPYPPGLEPRTCGVWIHYAIHSQLLLKLFF